MTTKKHLQHAKPRYKDEVWKDSIWVEMPDGSKIPLAQYGKNEDKRANNGKNFKGVTTKPKHL